MSFASVVLGACTSPLLIDDFSKWSSNRNLLGLFTSDDGSLLSSSAANGILTFNPKFNSYIYENIPCQEAKSNGYTSIQFNLKGSPGASMTLEMQARASCAAPSYQSYWYTLNNITGSTQAVTVPLVDFPGLNSNAITAFVWSSFKNVTSSWELSNIQFGCGTAVRSSPSASLTTLPSKPLAPSSTTGITRPTPKLSASNAATQPRSSGTISDAATTSTTCPNLLIDDWVSQSRLTFLYYNAMLQPSSDDMTMGSIVVSDNRVTLTPKSNSYFYSQVGCVNAKDAYGGISLRIKAPAGTSFTVQISSASECGGVNTANVDQTTSQLGWQFNGQEQLYNIPLSKYGKLDISKITTILFSGLNNAITLGPLAFYCGSNPIEYVLSHPSIPNNPETTVPAPPGNAPSMMIDEFGSSERNSLGFWHGGDESMTLTWAANRLSISSPDPDYSFYSQLSATCADLSKYENSYLHIAYSGSNAFSVALQQHNSQCNENIVPYPETWDSLEAARYASATDIYIPMSHFNIIKARVLGIALKGFYRSDVTNISKIEIVPSVPNGVTIPKKLPSGNLIFACKRPNSFAFAIDDGDPVFAQQVMQTIRNAGIKVTFFTVGAPLLDASTNLTNVYREMAAQGHQIALHSFTHPKMEGLPSYSAIDWEYNNDIDAVSKQLNGLHTPYFRPPFGTEGARMRQRLAVATKTDNPYIVNWSVDVQDWMWAMTGTPEKQLEAFQNDVDKGGNLVVMHYLYKSTVDYLPRFIEIAKKTGKKLMRVDQCMMDPNAPPL
ncbi:polysaccharide deacetylase [Tothia fuscella]|uniref:Polysaccharide deacetylase n=1 Tax=Tothia fuscella TaxID=1048955 RepID=A0A9P4NGY5_9PEZI|nr:polysaccharide deacetylase [Tothia fuscella]